MVCDCDGHNIWIEDMKFDDQNKYLLTVSENIRVSSINLSYHQTLIE